MNPNAISIIIPTLNEAGNIVELVERINRAMRISKMVYEIIFIDDGSKDGTIGAIIELEESYPISCYSKTGKKGKAFSLVQGFSHVSFELVAFIDADLQYPPEALPEMIRKIKGGYDIVIANRNMDFINPIRRAISKGFNVFFSKFLHGFDFDVQAGLKVFRKSVIRDVKTNPSPWTFDLEFLLKSRFYGYKIASVDIPFTSRKDGRSKIVFKHAIFEIGSNALKLKFKPIPFLQIRPNTEFSMIGAGTAFNRKRFITHTTMEHEDSAAKILAPWQEKTLIVLFMSLAGGMAINAVGTVTVFVAVLSFVYFLDTVFNCYLVVKSLKNPPEIKSDAKELESLRKESFPIYSVLCPLYKEAHMLKGFMDAIQKLDWPKEQLDVMLLLEENDKDTIRCAEKINLPRYVRIIIIPESLPKTKPKACNYGLSLAKGKYIVIYDAEDIPDSLQLKKAYLGFKKVPRTVGCLQAKLNYFNPDQNLLTKLFTGEYSLWFDMILPGLQSINTSIPLGGTSNHFRTRDLLEMKGWDPFNVTEDCDLGMRIFKKGYTTAIIDSVTLEEANSDLKNWLRQRSRWIKGYIQTYLVHMRHPVRLIRENGIHALIFQLVVGGKTAFVFINPILWLTTFSYFALYGLVGESIEKLYPPPIFFMAATSLVFGNFLAIYSYMIGCAKRGQWSLVKYIFLIPFYWALMSAASVIAIYQLAIKPHFWEKTNHGLQFSKAKEEKLEAERKLPSADKKPAFNWKTVPLGNYLEILFEPKNVFALAIMAANMVNFIFNIFLGRFLSLDNLAIVTLVSSVWYIISIFTAAFSSAVSYETAYFSALKKSSSSAFLGYMKEKGYRISLAVALVWIAATPFMAKFFNVNDRMAIILIAPAFILGIISSANSGFLQGGLHFRSAAIVQFSEAVSKFAFALAFVFLGSSKWVFASIPLSIAVSAVVSSAVTRKKTERKTKNTEKFIFPWNFFLSSLAAGVSMMLFFSLDIVLVKHFLPERPAGEYVVLSLVGKMIFFFGTLPAVFLIPLVGRNAGVGKNSKNIFSLVYIISFFLAATGVFFLGIMGKTTVPMIFGSKTAGILPYLNIYATSVFLLVISNSIVIYNLAMKKYVFSLISIIIPLSMAAGILLFHKSIGDVVMVIFWTSCGGWALLEAMCAAESAANTLKRNMPDFASVFWKKHYEAYPFISEKNKILIFNWRDMRHEYAGGAEVYVQRISENWVANGHEVTIFCGNDTRSPGNEIVGGVKIIRRGGFYLVYFWAFIYYMLYFRGKFDVIIDCQNGIPFFTPLFAREPIFCLMHHVHQEVFRVSLSSHLSALAMFLEKELMPRVYEGISFITVSESSRMEIKAIGLGKAGICVVNPGVDIKRLIPGKKSEKPVILYLGRLKAYKSIDILIRAFRVVISEEKDATLIIAGSGEEDESLKRLAASFGLSENNVKFTGKISEKEKISLLRKAWVLVNPSFMEGWGIVTIEAAACATPVVASDVPGLRDSVKNFETGYLACYGDVKSFSDCIIKIIKDKKLRRRMGIRARLWAENFDWEKSSRLLYAVISRVQDQKIEEKLAFSKAKT